MKDPLEFILPRIRSMHGYVPGLQLNDPEIIKLNTNENPFPVSPAVRAALEAALRDDRLHLYPEPRSAELRAAVAARFGRGPECVLIGNGSDDVLSILFRSVLAPGDLMVIPRPTYSLYPTLVDMIGATLAEVDVNADWSISWDGMREAVNFTSSKISVFANPNAPTGRVEAREDVLAYAQANPALTLSDEAYADFADFGAHRVAEFAGTSEYPRLLCCGTFSKTYSLAGQRIGWLIAAPDLIAEFDKVRDSYNVSRLAQVAALAAWEDQDELRRRIETVCANRDYLVTELKALGFETVPPSANFIFTKPPVAFAETKLPAGEAPVNGAQAFFELLKERKILVRYFGGGRIGEFVRITIGTREQMERLVAVSRELAAAAV